MTSSQTLINAIRQFEGLRLRAYQDSVGVWTIGYGHTRGVKKGQVISVETAVLYLSADLKKYEEAVNCLGVCKTQGQFDALVDFSFNLGTTSLRQSTLLRYIRAGKPLAEIQKQFLRWNKAGGKALAGLTKRRQWEANRFAE